MRQIQSNNNFLKRENDELKYQLDEARQSMLQRGVILSGPAIQKFVNENPEMGNRTLSHSHRTTKHLQQLLTASGSQPTESHAPPLVEPANLPGAVNTEGVTPVATDSDESTLVQTNQNSNTLTNQTASDNVTPELETIRKVANGKLLVEVRTRADVFVLFELSKKSKREFYVSEQLTRERQALMYDMRTYFKGKPNLQASQFTRNGTPTLKLGSDQLIPIRSQKELDDLIRKIEEN